MVFVISLLELQAFKSSPHAGNKLFYVAFSHVPTSSPHKTQKIIGGQQVKVFTRKCENFMKLIILYSCVTY